jgi:hypothetical protein
VFLVSVLGGSMTDRVLVPLPGIGTLALSADAYRDGLEEGAKLAAVSAPSGLSEILCAEPVD